MAVFPVSHSVNSTMVASLLSVLISLFPAAPLHGQETQVVEQQSATEAPLFFESRVRGILKEHCWHCHGEEADLRGNLDTRLVRQMLTGGDSGAAIEPGNHEESLL
ncbi:MAG: c-type cytochrome domain-containing protein, partial [Planctomycetaceae bacterium]